MRRRFTVLTALAIGAGIVAVYWYWGIRPARGLERGQVVEMGMATNRLQQSLWDTGYRPDDCKGAGKADPKYTCTLVGTAAEQVKQAAAQPSRSYYVVGKPVEGEPVHWLSFRLADEGGYILYVRDLTEADQGIFYGWRWETLTGTSDRDIRWFRYENPQLGQALKALRTAH